MNRIYNLLFVCTAYSARSLMAEALANQMGAGRIHAFSAGSTPRGEVNPHALEALTLASLPTAGLHSKGWEKFVGAGAVEMDMVITLCNRAAAETCPVWPGAPVTAHWSIPDPAAASGSQDDVQRAFATTLQMLRHRIGLLLALKPEALDHLALQSRVDEIGRSTDRA